MFIVFEGPDGAGKSTQLELFGQWLARKNVPATTCADPGSTALGTALRDILLRRNDLNIDVRSEMLMFMTARAQMVAETILPALEQGQVVVCDRFAMSTAVYQGFAGDLNVDDIWEVARIATNGLQPDLTFVFDLPLAELRKRLGPSRDRMESRSDDYFENVVQGYRQLANNDPQSVLIDATQSVDDIHQQVCQVADARMKAVGIGEN